MKTRPEQPIEAPSDGNWGSDPLALMLRNLGIRYVALNPGSSFRGLHDSLVNHLGNRHPQMLLCLHEEHAVALAHGWAKVTEEPMAVILHANVGLMHGSMAIYNAWCDRAPILILGATGPVDATKRRPWIDWIHTARDQAAIVRPYVKWDDQPASVEASLQAIVRAHRVARTAPMAPTYVCLDVTVQEERLVQPCILPESARFAPPASPAAGGAEIAHLVAMLREAEAPVILMGRVSRDPIDWALRVRLAETIGARVVTDIKVAAAFPTDHALHAGDPAFFLPPEAAAVLDEADVILSADWVDVAGTLRQAPGAERARIVQASLDHQLHNGWSQDHQAMAPADLHIPAAPDVVFRALAAEMGIAVPGPVVPEPLRAGTKTPRGRMDMRRLAAALRAGLAGEYVSLLRLPLGWDGAAWDFRHPLDYLGYDGGAGVGSGPGMAVGSALALVGSGRIPVAVLGDGDLMMGVSALWTAARYEVPLLIAVANNQSYFNDEIHQERIARKRSRPVENRWIGQRIVGPDVDIAGLARAQGLIGHGPIEDAAELVGVLRSAVAEVRGGAAVVIDIRVEAGYSAAMAKGMTGSAEGA